jgi:bifunctional non-homologous end joining protein LigD
VAERRAGGAERRRSGAEHRSVSARVKPRELSGATSGILRQLEQIRASGGRGVLEFGRGKSLEVSSLDKPYFPDAGITKGDVMRYYATVSSVLLPIIKDRPLILKRYPNGIHGESFFQQNAGDNVPSGVRTARVKTERGSRAERIIGGDLVTLLYTVQIGTIAVHTWQSRIQSAREADSATIDLDPGEDVPFANVVWLAKNIKVELDKLHLSGAIKTSGSSGLHIVLPLPPKTSFEVAARLADVIATRTVEANPEKATIERTIRARPPGTIYVDAQQNAEGKSVVAAYSLRERPKATVSAPLHWSELRRSLRLDMFTIESMPVRLAEVGDLWGVAMKRRKSKRAIDRALQEG